MPNEIVKINSLKFDGKIDKSWKAELISESEDLLTFVGIFEHEITHSHLGIIRHGTVSYEFYWKNKSFNVFRFHEPEGPLRNYYCNINLPPVFENKILEYVDLDVDILLWKDMRYDLLDLDEFLENAVKYNYPPDIHQIVLSAINELLEMIKSKTYPFNYKD